MTTRKGKFTSLNRLPKGTIFLLSASPAETMSWEVMRHVGGGLTEARRLHEDRTPPVQRVHSTLMVFVPETETEEPEGGDVLDADDTISIDPLLDNEVI